MTKPVESLSQLFEFFFQQDRLVVVFTNLGRKPQVVFDVLEREHPHSDVVVCSPYYHFPSRGRIDTVQPHLLQGVRCDLLLLLEPTPTLPLPRPPEDARRMVVLASHLSCDANPKTTLFLAYFHPPPGKSVEAVAALTRSMVSRRENSVQSHDARNVQVDHTNQRFVDGKALLEGALDPPTGPPYDPSSQQYVVVNLTRLHSKMDMYLAFWDAFDLLLALDSRVDHWLVCFPEKVGFEPFDQFTQNVIDGLYCCTFSTGNVLDKRLLFALLPFFQDGALGGPFEGALESFGGIPYLIPEDEYQLYQAARHYNLTHLVGGLYRQVEDAEDTTLE